MVRSPRTIIRASKWGVKSLAGLAANLALLTAWVEWFGVPPWVAIWPNWLIISIAGYAAAMYWVWPDKPRPGTVTRHVRQWFGMQAANATGKLSNYAVFIVLLPFLDYRAAWVVGACLTFVVTFAANHAWWTYSTRISIKSN